jgi:hypothetical protein
MASKVFAGTSLLQQNEGILKSARNRKSPKSPLFPFYTSKSLLQNFNKFFLSPKA